MMYSEGWRQRIESSAPAELLITARNASAENPLVTVALRSDGSVESVTINRTSGVPEVDEAIRRTVHALAPYQAFPAGMAQDFDVVEIRRTWTFETALRLFAGGR
jgi:TonB family protein